MRKFVQEFTGVTGENILPSDFMPGDVCPDDLITAAEEAGALDQVPASVAKSAPAAAAEAGALDQVPAPVAKSAPAKTA